MSATRSTGRCARALVLVASLAVACDAPGPQPSAPAATASSGAGGAECAPDDIARSGIDGMIVDSDGNPLADILVHVDNSAGFTGSARTPEDGTFSAPGVTGEFVITTVDLHYDSVTQRVTVPCGETVDVEIILTPSDA